MLSQRRMEVNSQPSVAALMPTILHEGSKSYCSARSIRPSVAVNSYDSTLSRPCR